MAEEAETEEWTHEDIVDRGVPFRVLIIGRANAGKTTILERLCESTVEEAKIFRNGVLTERRMEKGERGRGNHDIEDAMVFPSLPGFVFHDSRGLESGADTEVTTIEAFVKDRTQSVKDKRQQLHAIWICLSLDDNHRPLSDAEEKLCRVDSHGVPVIAIFTKSDAIYNDIFNKERNNGGSTALEASKKAKTAVEEAIKQGIEKIRNNLDPGRFRQSNCITAPDLRNPDENVRLRKPNENVLRKHKEKCEAFCQDLISRTQNLLPSSKMQALLVTVWRNNISERTVWVFRSLLNRICVSSASFKLWARRSALKCRHIDHSSRVKKITKQTVARHAAVFLPVRI
ncbi:hypothetical protein OF83DRAFT_1141705 [Amylostereum chailletii]|nr:hypothetical protein OF83DRAFT_1141705 [Amylostereum chailletii]